MNEDIFEPTSSQYRSRERAAFLAFRAALYEAHSRGFSLTDLITVIEVRRPATGVESLNAVIEADLNDEVRR